MAIQVGDTIPSVTIKVTDTSDVTTDDLFRGKKVVLFAVTGAFTPTCSNQHLPGFVTHADALPKHPRQGGGRHHLRLGE